MLSSFKIDENTIFIDLFGGSGLLSHAIKRAYPKCRVIWNDYNDYQSRLDKIDTTEQIRAKLIEILGVVPPKEKNIVFNNKNKAQIYALLESYDESELDTLQLSSWLCFSGSYFKDYKSLKPAIKYHRTPQTPLDKSGYLAGVERVQKDFNELLGEFKADKNAFFIYDPPYLQTNTECYTQHFRLSQFLNLANFFLLQERGIWFSSQKSDCKEFFEWYIKEARLKIRLKKLENLFSNAKDKDILFYFDKNLECEK